MTDEFQTMIRAHIDARFDRIERLLAAPRPKFQPIKRRSRKEGPFSKSQHKTLAVFQDNGRNVQASAEALGITRQSMEGRLSRLREKLKTTKATHFLEKLKPYRTPRKKLQALPTDLRGNIAI